MRYFNTAGPVNCADHYCLPPLERFDLAEVMTLIEQRKYFVLHAPRQTGKTTCLLALMAHLNRDGAYRAVYVNVEGAQAARENVEAGMKAILSRLGERARIHLNDLFPGEAWEEILRQRGGYDALNVLLTRWAEADPQPLVLLIDEIDSLVGDTLIAVLRQLRAGYDTRPAHFPATVLLCGVRDVRDYRIHSDREKAQITGGSAFNIKAASLRLGDFSQTEVGRLYDQHKRETGQVFEPAAMDTVWELTSGQPWLANALGYEVCFDMREGRDRSRPITAAMVFAAKENLILRRETHLDQLADKLKEDRVRRVIEPILQGEAFEQDLRSADVQYVIDLGLVQQDRPGHLQIANRIYQEIIPRELAWEPQMGITVEPAWYVRADGRLDLSKLLAEFQQFFREHVESWIERFAYKEAGPQLLLQAFLQRIVNHVLSEVEGGGGRIEREYGLGRRRTDLLVIWPHPGGVQRGVIELKIRYGALEGTIADGLAQTWEYADRCGADQAHLVIFDRTPGKPWTEKIFRQEQVYRDLPISVWGM